MVAILFWLFILVASTVTAVPVWMRMLESGMYDYLPVAFSILPLLVLLRLISCQLPKGFFRIAFLTLGIGAIGFCYYQESPWFAAAGWGIVFATFLSCCSSRGRLPKALGFLRPLMGSMTGLAPLTLMLVQVPRNFDSIVVNQTYSFAGQLTSFMLDLLSIPNSVNSRVRLHSIDFIIEDLHPTIYSPLVMAFILILIAVVKKRSPWAAPCYFMAGIITSMFLNSLFAVSVVVAKNQFDVDLLNGWPCLTTHIVISLAGLLFALSLDRVLLVTLFPTRPDDLNQWNNPIISLWNRAFHTETSV
ncbi:MAG: hypothetical protein U0930_17040 [Pirellulales bacterium]